MEKLEASYITPDLARQALLTRVTSREGAEIIGKKDGRDYAGIVFPYTWLGKNSGRHPIEDGRVREYRLRRDNPDIEYKSNGEQREVAKYLSPPGTRGMIYFVPGTRAEWLTDTSIPVVVVEGEKKTIALFRLAFYERGDLEVPRFLPAGIGGVWNWRGRIGRESDNGGHKIRDIVGPIPDLDDIEWHDRVVYILFDYNVHTNLDVRAARSRLASELKGRGARIYYGTIPRLPGVNGIDDFLGRQGPEAGLALIKNAQAADVKAPQGFRVSEFGVYALNNDGGEDLWICSPLMVSASTRDQKNQEWGQLLTLRDRDGQEHTWLMPMELLAGDGGEYRQRLLSMGLQIAPGRRARELLTNYIQTANPDLRARCVSRVGWFNNVFALPDETFGEESGERVFYQSPINAEHYIGVAGTLDDWKKQIGRYCENNSLLMFAICCAFAGPLIPLLAEGSGGFHLKGKSSTGKTTALLVAGTVWGGGGRNGYVQNWRTTQNGVEAIAEIHNHGLLCLDEMGQCDPRDVGEIAYILANGAGKLRMTRTMGSRRKLEWELLFLSSGETSLCDHVTLSGQHVRGGQEVRLCDLAADAGAGMGIFEDLHDFESASELARHLSTASRKVYGSPIRAYLTMLARNRSGIEEDARRYRSYFLSHFVPAGAGGEVQRVASRFALVAAAGEIAIEITGWELNAAMRAVAHQFKRWLTARGTLGSFDVEVGVRAVQGFIELHGNSRFQYLSRGAQPVINRVGFKQDDSAGGTEYLIFPEAFKTQVAPGYDHQALLRALATRGYLRIGPGEDGARFQVRERVSELGRQVRFYCYRYTREEPETESCADNLL